MADEKFSNFLTEIIDADLAEGKVKEIHTRFPPEPNGYLHIGSAKAIYINYMTAKTYGGKFNLRFDDTNPAREGDEYVQSILKDLEWLGATPNGGIFYGSDYFEKCYEYAEKLIQEGKAYVDEQSAEIIAQQKGTPTQPGTNSPFRDRPVEESLDVYIAVLGSGANGKALELVQSIRYQGFKAERDYLGRKIKAQFKSADTFKAKTVITLGESEVESGEVNVKNNTTREEVTVSFEELTTNFATVLKQLEK